MAMNATISAPAGSAPWRRSGSAPPVRRNYRVEEVDAGSLANLPGGIDSSQYRWVDLDGEGISGVLTEQDCSWLYKPNLGAGRFGTMEEVGIRPSGAALSKGHQQGGPFFPRTARATMVPTPGADIKSRARVSLRAIARSRFSKPLNSRRSVARTASSDAAIAARFGWPSTSSLMRA
jgi:hypothetical protein